MDTEQIESSPARWLLTALGVRPTETTYQLEGDVASAEHAPLALLELLAAERRALQTHLNPEGRDL